MYQYFVLSVLDLKVLHTSDQFPQFPKWPSTTGHKFKLPCAGYELVLFSSSLGCDRMTVLVFLLPLFVCGMLHVYICIYAYTVFIRIEAPSVMIKF